jgi:hypothetical protein
MQSPKQIWNIWLPFWAFLLALCWLIPNHSPPWQWFVSDCWTAAMLLVVVPILLFAFKQRVVWSQAHSLALLLACIPLIQYACGVVIQFGTAWMATAYLLGLLYAILLGSHWESNRPGQMVDGLLLAMGVAAIASVAMQIYQWLGLEALNWWVLGAGPTRQAANLGQPNMLASLLVMGCLSFAWGYERQKVNGVLTTFACIFITTGVALTGSRTAGLAAAILTAFMWRWRGHWKSTCQPWVATGLLVYLLILSTCLPFLRHLVFDDGAAATMGLQQLTRTNSEQRFVAWPMFWHAIWVKPWLGYGWSQMVFAHAEVATLYPQLHSTFSSSHNLLIDILLSCGIPVGLLLIGVLAWWLYKTGRFIGNAENAIVFLILLVLLNHAMLELPLYYGYFLWPAGMLVGALLVRTASVKKCGIPRYAMLVGWLVCALMLASTVYDYFSVEDEYQSSTMNAVSIHSTRTLDTRRYRVLTQWDDFFKYGKLMRAQDMQDADIAHLQSVVLMWPTADLFNKLAMALAIRNRPEEAALWIGRACAMTPETSCADLLQYWQNVLYKSPEFARVRLPSTPAP